MAGGKNKEPIVVAQIIGTWVGGGVEAVIMNYYRHIDRTKVQFDFICDEDSTNIPYEEIEKLGGKVVLCPPYQKLHKYMKFLKKLFREKKYRIVHSNINTLSVFPLRAAKKAGVPVRIAHSHSTSNPREMKRNLIKNILRKFSKKYATDYFACGEAAGRYQFGNKAFDAGKVKIIPNAIDIEKFKFDPDARKKLRKEIGLKDNDFVIGHIGRFVETKNHTFLIDVFAEFKKERKNAKLVLVGQGPLRKEIEDKVKQISLEGDVLFLGQRDDVDKIYSTFDVFCLPSFYEGFPVVGIEAQANGLYCILSDNIAREVAISSNVVFASIDNIQAYLSKINNTLRTNVVEKTKYSINDQASIVERIYRSLANIKIMHLVSTKDYSGAENVACQIIGALKENDKVDMVYVSPAGDVETILNKKKIKHICLSGFSYREVKRVIVEFKPDIIHAHDIKASVMATLFYKKAYIVAHVHNNHEKMRARTIKSLLFRLASKKMQKIIWVSDSAREDYYYRRKVSEKSIVLYNAIDSVALEQKAKEDKNSYNYDFVFIGRLTFQKNPERLLAILANLAKIDGKIKTAVIGDGELREKVEREIREHKLKDNVSIMGFVDNPYKLLAQSKALIMTSRFEGTPMVALEAIALGVPIISTPADGMKKIIDDGKNGYICEKDDDFIEKILLVFREKQCLDRLKANCRKINEAINNLDGYKKAIVSVYDECIRGSK